MSKTVSLRISDDGALWIKSSAETRGVSEATTRSGGRRGWVRSRETVGLVCQRCGWDYADGEP